MSRFFFPRMLLFCGISLGIIFLFEIIFGETSYLWIKAFHIIAIIAWMAGLLYLPRLFIYHCDASKESLQSETFKIMERRLLNYIMNPAMIVSWVLGLWLAWRSQFFSLSWFQAKFILALCLSAIHGHFSAAVRRFEEDRNQKSVLYWRIMNEVPTALMVGMVILVVVKPYI